MKANQKQNYVIACSSVVLLLLVWKTLNNVWNSLWQYIFQNHCFAWFSQFKRIESEMLSFWLWTLDTYSAYKIRRLQKQPEANWKEQQFQNYYSMWLAASRWKTQFYQPSTRRTYLMTVTDTPTILCKNLAG